MVIRHSAHRGRCLGVLLMLVASCCTGVTAIGVNYGTVADNLPTPDQVVKLVQSTYISQVKIYSTDPTILSAFANSGISLVVSTTNDEISPIAASESFAQQWITSNVASHYPSTDIVCIVVGNEVLTSAPNSSYDLLPAMQNLHTGLTNLGLDDKIKVSTPHSYGVMGTSYPPSIGAFRADLSTPIFSPMLDFLSQTGAPFMINAYPYFAYREDPTIALAYAMFEPSTEVMDSATGLTYKNLFDAQVDATYAAIAKLGHTDITVIVSETGWPSFGDADEVGVGLTNAQAYTSNLLQHVNTNDGTPGKPNAPVDTYIFALFNENQKPGPSSERNFGLFLPDQSMVYNVGLVTGNTTGTGSPPPPPVAPTNPSPPSPAAPSPQSPPAFSPESPPAFSPESPPAFSPETPPAFSPESPPAFTQPPPAFPQPPPAFSPESPPAFSPETPPPPPAFTQPPPAFPQPPPAFSPESPPAFSPETPPPPPAFTQPPPAFPQPPPAFTPSASPTESPIAPSPFSSTPSTPPPPPSSGTPPPPFTAPPPPYPVPHVPPTTGTSPPPPPATTTAPPPPPATSSYPPPATSTPPPPPSFFSPPPGSTTAPSPAGTPPFFPSPSPESPPPPAPAAPSPESPPPPAPPAPVTPSPVSPSPPAPVTPSPVSPSPPAPAAPSPESPPPPTTPETPSPAGGGAPPGTPPAPPGTASGPNTWCVAKPGSPPTDMANALNYACGEGGADCTQIQTGAACFNPDTLFSHASYAFSSYYALNGRNYWNCFFGNSSLITITNPSYAGCEFP